MISNGKKEFPDIFLAGTPKSGTTFLFDLLAQHPAVSPSYPKEPFYHVDESNPYVSKEQDYRFFFKHSGKHLDGTSQTIYQKEILQEIGALEDKPRILVVLRDPSERILSSFLFTSYNLSAVKSSLTFDEYVEILLTGEIDRIRPHCRNVEAFFSLSQELIFSAYGGYLEAWRNVVGDKNLMVVVFEHLKQNTIAEVKKVLRFLELPEKDDFSLATIERNSSQDIRHRSLHFFLRKIYQRLGYRIPFKKAIKSVYGSFQQNAPSSIDHEKSLRRLTTYFRPHNQELAQNFDVDLSMWRL